MAYQTGTASNQEDLMQAFYDFAVDEGWTGNIFSAANDWCAINNGTEFFQFRWDNNNGIGIFHSTAFVNTSTAPGNHTGSSGLGSIDSSAPYNSTIPDVSTSTFASACQQIRVNNTAITAYHFFTPASGQQYIHMAVERSPGTFEHLSVGTINKRGTWTGGGYSSGSRGTTGTSFSIETAAFGIGANNRGRTMFAMRAEGLPNQIAAGRWLSAAASTTSLSLSDGDDLAGNERGAVFVCAAGQGLSGPFLGMPADPMAGLVPLFPMELYYMDNPVSNDQRFILLGYIPGALTMNMRYYNPGQEFTVGGNTYMVFPPYQKGSAGRGNGNRGIAYLKVV